MSPFQRGDGPTRPRPPVSVFNVPSQPVLVQLLGEFLGVWLHWPKARGRRRRSAPCLLVGCRHCGQVKRSGYGYVPAMVWDPVSRQLHPIVLSVPGLNRDGFAPPHAGKWYELKHNGIDVRGPLSVRVRDDLDARPLAPPFDVLPYVAQVLGITEGEVFSFDWDTADLSVCEPLGLTPPAELMRAIAGRPAAADKPPPMTAQQAAKLREWNAAWRSGDRELAARLRREFEALGPGGAAAPPPGDGPDGRPAADAPPILPFRLPDPAAAPTTSPPADAGNTPSATIRFPRTEGA
jgi:hypothetical protein